MPALQLAVFGPVRLELDGVRMTHLPTTKTQALLAYLAVETETPHGRDALMGLLWPDFTPQRARQNLRQALFRLRQTIPAHYLRITNQTVQFDPASDHSLDVTTFTTLLAACRRHAHAELTACRECSERLQEAIDLYRGDFLAGFFVDDAPAFEEWLLLKREWLRREVLQALTLLAIHHEQQGADEQAYRYAWRQVELDPGHEEAHRQLMRILARSGRRSEALAQYLRCRRLLADELGVEPAPETTALYEQIRAGIFDKGTGRQGDRETRGQGDLITPSPCHLVTPSSLHPFTPLPAHNLPSQLTSFIGRQRELEEVKMLLAPAALGAPGQGVRLLTLTGAGGCGKTRLALQVAQAMLAGNWLLVAGDAAPNLQAAPSGPAHHPPFPDGVWFVDLAPLSDPPLVIQAVAAVLGVREQPQRALLVTLLEVLTPRRLLVVLDNCEHLVAACAHLVDALLRAAPGLRILATSREALAVAGEITWRVPGLGRPQLQPLPPLTQLAQFEAVRFFVARATTALPTFRLTASNAATVAQICRQLDGLPLALELAAARVKVLTLEQIAARLHDRFGLLTGGSRSSPPRQQTLRATLDWSYDLLSEPERVLLRRLAVFAGGFTLEAVEAVVALRLQIADCTSVDLASIQNPKLPSRTSVVQPSTSGHSLDLLSSLVDKSLVVVDRQPDGGVRYRLLETIRQYGLERLAASGEEAEMRRRHAHFYLARAEEAEPELHGAQLLLWRQRLEMELDNLRTALAWSQSTPVGGELGLRLAGTLADFWIRCNRLREGRDWLEDALQRMVAHGRTPARAKALHAAGCMADNMNGNSGLIQ